jgi:predicted Zn-dependent protease
MTHHHRRHRRATCIVLTLLAPLLLSGCGPSRRVIPPGEIPRAAAVTAEDEEYGQRVLSELSKSYPLDRDDTNINRVRSTVGRLARAAGADRSPWNVYVMRGDGIINAAATRGHFVFVWTGMLRTTRNDAELATVLAHELGHVLAGHTQATSGEEAARIIAQLSGQVARQATLQQGGQYGALAGVASAVVSQLMTAILVNPEQQRQELEADQIGLFLLADAGYDPRAALDIWTRFGQTPAIAEPSAAGLLSSHPAIPERIDALKQLMPRALTRYYQRTRGAAPPSSTQRTRRSHIDPDDSFVIGRD